MACIIIAYSQEKDLDGRIRYDKFDIIDMAKDCDMFYSKRLFQFLYGMLMSDKLSFKVYAICTG